MNPSNSKIVNSPKYKTPEYAIPVKPGLGSSSKAPDINKGDLLHPSYTYSAQRLEVRYFDTDEKKLEPLEQLKINISKIKMYINNELLVFNLKRKDSIQYIKQVQNEIEKYKVLPPNEFISNLNPIGSNINNPQTRLKELKFKENKLEKLLVSLENAENEFKNNWEFLELLNSKLNSENFIETINDPISGYSAYNGKTQLYILIEHLERVNKDDFSQENIEKITVEKLKENIVINLLECGCYPSIKKELVLESSTSSLFLAKKTSFSRDFIHKINDKGSYIEGRQPKDALGLAIKKGLKDIATTLYMENLEFIKREKKTMEISREIESSNLIANNSLKRKSHINSPQKIFERYDKKAEKNISNYFFETNN